MPDPIRRPSIIVVEDEDTIAAALDYLILREGYVGERLSSGTGAATRIRAQQPDLVLLDVMLPGVSGYDICRDLRADPALSATRILMLTALASPARRQLGLELGADGFMAKPFDLNDLRSEMRRLLSRPI